MRCAIVALSIFAVGLAHAELNERVANACFSARVSDYKENQNWLIKSFDNWANAPMNVKEEQGATVVSQEGSQDPRKRFRTSITLKTPSITDANPFPIQTLTYTVQLTPGTDKASIKLDLISDAVLPPCKTTQWQKFSAIEALDGAWYIIVPEEKAVITSKNKNGGVITYSVALPMVDLESGKTSTAKLYVGEGPLPSPTCEP